jgi:predicted nucleic acid-binding protein
MSGSASHRRQRVFVDTSAFFAIADTSDQRSDEATAVFLRLTSERASLFTTNYVLAELHALLLARVHRDIALSAAQRIRTSNSVTVIRAEAGDERRAWEIIERYDDKWFSLTDAISFAVMERLRISHAFSLDDDFKQFGWIALRLDDSI